MAGPYGETSCHHLSNVTFGNSQLDSIARAFEKVLSWHGKELHKIVDRLEGRRNELSYKNKGRSQSLEKFIQRQHVVHAALVPLSPSEVCEDQKILREKIEREKSEKEREEMIQQEKREKERDTLRAKEIEKKIEVEKIRLREKESMKLFSTSNSHCLSSGDINMQEIEEMKLKEKPFKLPILRRVKQCVDILSSASLFIQPKWRHPQRVMKYKSIGESFIMPQIARHEVEYKHVVFDPGDWEWMYTKKEWPLSRRPNVEFKKTVFDPGGMIIFFLNSRTNFLIEGGNDVSKGGATGD